jgi:CRP-like cAMP-binding protein
MADIFLLILTALFGLIYSFLRSQPGLASEPVLDYLWWAVVIGGAVILVRITSYLLVDVLMSRLWWKPPSQLLRLLIVGALYGIAITLIFRFVLHVDVVAIVTASAIVGSIIALAVNTTLGHLCSGIALNLERPFRVGDYIKVGEQVGEVASSSWRSITVRTFYGSLLVYPNSKIMNDTVEVFPASQEPSSLITIPVPASVAPQKVARIINDVIRAVPHVKRNCSPLIQVDEFTFDNRLTGPWITLYRVIYYPDSARIAWYTDGLIKERVWYAFSRNGIGGFRDDKDGGESARRHLDLIAANPIFRDIGADETLRLSKSAIGLLYAAGEPVFAQGDVSRSMFIVCQGTVNVQPGEGPETGSAKVAEEALKASNTSQSIWQPHRLDRISSELANHMGPIARYLVRQAAAKTSDPYSLYRMLAREIADPADRAAFLEGSPTNPVVQLRQGDFFGELSLFTGTPASMPAMEAADEVELLELRPTVLAGLLAGNADLATVFSDRLAEYRAQTGSHLFASGQSEASLDRYALLQRINSFHHVGSEAR